MFSNTFFLAAIRTLFALCVINIPLFLMSYYMPLNRAILNLDFFVPLFIYFFRPWLAYFVFAILFIIELLVASSNIFFFDPATFLFAIKNIPNININAGAIIVPFLFLIFEVLLFAFVSKLIYYKNSFRQELFSLVFFILIAILFEIFNGTSYLSRYISKDGKNININISGSPAYTLLRQFHYNGNSKTQSFKSSKDNNANYILNYAQSHPNDSIILILIESYGIPKSIKVQNWLNSKLLNDTYTTEFSITDSDGSTTNGELRFLCNLKGNYRQLDTNLDSTCLPNLISQFGWKSFGLHGFSPFMFERYIWWHNIGFSQLFFAGNEIFADDEVCGDMFRGVCDDSMIRHAFRFSEIPNSLIYLLTLNTHLPVSRHEIPSELNLICKNDSVPIESCMHIAAIGGVLDSVAQNIKLLKTYPLIVLQGDHPPPFYDFKNRDSFSTSAVPNVRLIPKH